MMVVITIRITTTVICIIIIIVTIFSIGLIRALKISKAPTMAHYSRAPRPFQLDFQVFRVVLVDFNRANSF